jgi:ferrous iron transport protein B
VATRAINIALVGAPNSGKSTLFNALTGLSVKTGNYPGVTVGRSVGTCSVGGADFAIEDLPGTYSLEPISIDESIVADLLRGELAGVEAPDGIIVVADATTLRRSLILLADVLALGLPTALCLTMHDELVNRGGSIDTDLLGNAIGIPVVAIDGRRRGAAAASVLELLSTERRWPKPVITPPFCPQERSAWIESVLAAAEYRSAAASSVTAKVDRVLLHPVAGTVVFFAVMFAFFQTIFAVAAPVQDLIGNGLSSLGTIVRGALGDSALTSFVADALIGGVGAVLVFVPQIALLFILIAVLEQVGYLSRAAFLMDRVMSLAGLEGRAFVAMLSSFACAIPGIMATRTMPSAKERLATMLAVPLVTCSARLPVYTLLIGLLISPHSRLWIFGAQGVVLFGLYVVGAISMVVAARVVTAISGRRGQLMPFSMEMPPYRIPALHSMALAVWMPVKGFLRKVGTIILLATVVLWALLNLPVHSQASIQTAGVDTGDSAAVASYTMKHSLAADVGHAVEPVFAPLGFDWRTNVAVISSLAARETFVATLGQMTAATDPDDPADALKATTFDDGPKAGQPVYTTATLIALLVFFVYALQCTATIAVLRRETGTWRWPLSIWTTYLVLAWLMAFGAHSIAVVAAG